MATHVGLEVSRPLIVSTMYPVTSSIQYREQEGERKILF
jgi:hypothetical protein